MKRKLMALFVACATVVVSVVVVLDQVKASNVHKISYERYENYKSLWEEKEAPVKEGCVFGGWYQKDGQTYTPISEEDMASYTGDAYAKYVPSYVLSIKTQNTAGTKENDGATSMRVVSSVDSKEYQKVGFEIWFKNTIQITKSSGEALETTKIYSGIKVADNDVRTPEQVFGEASKFLTVWRLDNIADKNDAEIIYVRPYWITQDGTTVKGLARYVHVEDGYKNYINIPVNLMAGEAVAAGGLQVICDDSRFQLYEVETGRIFEEVTASGSGSTVNIVGNASTVDDNKDADGILANVRFRLVDGATYETGKGESLSFQIQNEEFYAWSEEPVSIDVWDYLY